MYIKTRKTFLITGASQGLGLATVKYLLAKDQLVIATTRHKETFTLRHENLEVINLDITSEDAVQTTVDAIIRKYGQIDVLINNAGYGFLGAVEEASQEEIEKVIGINLYATMRLTRCVLPHMRKVHAGHIINLSSIAGIVSAPGFGVYNASKYAVEGFTEALHQEVAPLGIKVTLIEPGAFRTNFLNSSLALSKQSIADYDATAGHTKKRFAGDNGTQAGDPERAAEAIIAIAGMDNPPLRLLLGEDAYILAAQKLKEMLAGFEQVKTLTLSTGFEHVEPA